MKIGDILTIKPNFYTEYMGGNDGPRPARVVYIHPLVRFYVAEFRSDLGTPLAGDVLSLYPADRGYCGQVRAISAA